MMKSTLLGSRIAPLLLCLLVLLGARNGAAQCKPQFPLEVGKPMGWQGADAAYSIPLPDGRDVWIFGDTLYGPHRVVNGHDPQQVHNSLGISTCAGGTWKLDYVIKKDTQGQPDSYFSPANKTLWYWAMDGVYAEGSLWVTLLCIRHAEKPQPWAMDFETCGSDLAQVSHLERDPQHWSVTIRPLVADGVKAYPSASAVVDGDFAYFFALYEHGERPLLVTRVRLNNLASAAQHLEYLAQDGSWRPGFDPSQAKEVMARGSSELSVRYHPELHQWRAVLFEPGLFSPRIITRNAPSLAGPWTEETLLYQAPEMLNGPAKDKDVFCYAAKEHPEFETATAPIVATYVCNTMNVPNLVKQLTIYHPQVIAVSPGTAR